jgi:hypothetical protein
VSPTLIAWYLGAKHTANNGSNSKLQLWRTSTVGNKALDERWRRGGERSEKKKSELLSLPVY